MNEPSDNRPQEDDQEVVENNISKSPTEQPRNEEALVVSEDQDEENEKGQCNRFLKARGCSCIAHVPGKYPRTFSICTGVFFPLWLLVFVSLFFGHFLAKIESQGEIDSNDAFMKLTVVSEGFTGIVGNTVTTLPIVCQQLYVNGTRRDQVEKAFMQIIEERGLAEYVDESNEAPGEIVTWSTADLREFMTDCGRVALDAITSIQERWYRTLEVDTSVGGLSFNWIRCVNDSNAENDLLFPGKRQIEASRPEAQAYFYSQTWRERQLSLGEKYLEEFIESNESRFTDYLEGFGNSVDDTTAGDKCDVHSISGAWFWFTVMTTVGKFEARSSLSPDIGGLSCTQPLRCFSINRFWKPSSSNWCRSLPCVYLWLPVNPRLWGSFSNRRFHYLSYL
jgi:hypothetical protein